MLHTPSSLPLRDLVTHIIPEQISEADTWPFKKSPDALHLSIPILAQKRPETF